MMCVVTLIGSENTVRCYLSVLDHFSPHIREDTLGWVVRHHSSSRVDLEYVTFRGPPIDDSETLNSLPDNLRSMLESLNGFI